MMLSIHLTDATLECLHKQIAFCFKKAFTAKRRCKIRSIKDCVDEKCFFSERGHVLRKSGSKSIYEYLFI